MERCNDGYSSDPDFRLIESILWHRRFFLLEEHRHRLAGSALKFGFSYEPRRIEGCLRKFETGSLTKGLHYKVRVLLSRNGFCTVTAEELPLKKLGPWRLAVSAVRTDSSNIFLYHKTTNRQLYDSELKKYLQSGYHEVLFCNERGEVTEGSFTNVLAKINGSWVTPDLRCGLLPGVFRQHLLKRMRGRLVEARISVAQLAGADRIFVCNSVRGCIATGSPDTIIGVNL